ncbi:aminoglycoside phosphotransferase family protein [Bradyrhizobium daqingense]|uniref:Phosphotransferase family enzyme n=1 Tax=Bradyrhizobium daqingense TaxID=993502 RepID=A0A562LQK6_9BRAD|nr:aminoglycoside phosphotransferase family protein [Bradyrhizobium daqingense]TWI09899.1 phosphotransferase family enzyme [Bradyrhizobium daqingense]UFS88215.1 aminoglycoside phosphotransferase family protein [Bradyrhizobium daqingense]
MLSKIAFHEADHRPDIAAERACLLPALRQHLQSSGSDVTVAPVPDGTLGICFTADIIGEKRFMKTHLPGAAARGSLAKEAEILFQLYGETIVLDRFEIRLADETDRLCLMMPALAPLTGPMPSAVAAAMADALSERLNDLRPGRLASFEHYLASAERALKMLSERGLLKRASAAEMQRLIALLGDRLPDLPSALCHGDFGPKNIMLQAGEPRVIDWEDAFNGIAGYDYLYWLTFMENRPFLQRDAFGRTNLSQDVERAILALVVLLKSYLAVLSGAHLKHALSAEARIAEILDLPG